MTRKELKKLLQDVVLTSWEDESATLAQIGMALSKLLENPRVIEVMDAEYKKSLAELENLTRTTMDKSIFYQRKRAGLSEFAGIYRI